MTETPTNYVEANGFAIAHAGPDRVVIEWDVSERHLQPFGIVHGGVYCTAVETAASYGGALWLGERVPGATVVGVSNQTDFLRAVGTGHHLKAVGTPIHQGRSQQLWLVEITDEQNRLLARGHVRLQNLDPR